MYDFIFYFFILYKRKRIMAINTKIPQIVENPIIIEEFRKDLSVVY
jgi:hypothetical protein